MGERSADLSWRRVLRGSWRLERGRGRGCFLPIFQLCIPVPPRSDDTTASDERAETPTNPEANPETNPETTPETPPQGRPHCYRCDKPRRTCVCDSLTELANRVGVHVLQHHRERRHPIGTARLLRLGLKNVEVHVLRAQGTSAVSPEIPLPAGAGLLYPSADAIDIGLLPPEDRPTDIVVIDGTWSHAHRIYRDNPWIQALPHVKITPAEESRYRIRKEPRSECLSTLEAVVTALRVAEPELRGTEMLLSAFDRMIDAQIAAREGARRHDRSKRPRTRPSKAVPQALTEAPERVIVVYAEPAPNPGASGRHEPLRLVAQALRGAELFDGWIASRVKPDAYLCARLGVEVSRLEGARPSAQVLRAFEDFCRTQAGGAPVLAYWGAWMERLLGERFPDLPRISLKRTWSNLAGAAARGLAAVVRGEGLGDREPELPGRAGERLSDALVLTQHIYSRTQAGRTATRSEAVNADPINPRGQTS